MYAVIKAGARQYKVSQGDKLEVDFIDGQAGDKVTFDKVLMVAGASSTFGAPFVSGAVVSAKISEQIRMPKVYAIRYRRRKNSKRITGHRQPMTVVEIEGIQA